MQIQDVHFLHNDWTILEAFSKALPIENQKVKGAQLAPFTFRISAQSGATFNFTKKVKNLSNLAKSSKASKILANQEPSYLSKGKKTMVV